jgi:hypothetical protein
MQVIMRGTSIIADKIKVLEERISKLHFTSLVCALLAMGRNYCLMWQKYNKRVSSTKFFASFLISL